MQYACILVAMRYNVATHFLPPLYMENYVIQYNQEFNSSGETKEEAMSDALDQAGLDDTTENRERLIVRKLAC